MKISIIQHIFGRVKWENQEVGAENNMKSGGISTSYSTHRAVSFLKVDF